MKRFALVLMLSLVLQSQAENRTYSPQVKTLQAVINKDWLSPTVMRLYGNDFLNITFDELSHALWQRLPEHHF